MPSLRGRGRPDSPADPDPDPDRDVRKVLLSSAELPGGHYVDDLVLDGRVALLGAGIATFAALDAIC